MPHTPGPWFRDEKGHVYAEKYYELAPPFMSDGKEVRDYYRGLVALPYSAGDGGYEANARLIAAAPELAEHLHHVRYRKTDRRCFHKRVWSGHHPAPARHERKRTD